MYHIKVDNRGAVCGWPWLSEYIEFDVFACVCTGCVWVCVLYHCKPFCWCFLLLILSLGSCYIKLLSGLCVWKKKLVSSASVHIYSTLPTVQGNWVCVGRRWEETEWKRVAQIQKQKYLQRERKRQRGGSSVVVMLSRKRKITLPRQEHKGSKTNSVVQQRIPGTSMFGEKRYSTRRRATRGEN